MNTCDRWQHLCGPHPGPADPALLAHVERCAECRAALAKWRVLEPEIIRTVELDLGEIPVRDRLVLERVHARIGATRRPAPVRLAWVGIAAAALLAVGLFLALGRGEDGSAPRVESPRLAASATVFAGSGAETRKVELKAGASLEVAPGDRASVRIERHRLEVEGGAAVRLVEVSRAVVRIELVRGEASFDVDFGPRRGAFSVEAGDVSVAVKGTRFTVGRSANLLTVAVEEGRVAVARGGREIAILAAKERLEIDTAAREGTAQAPTAKPPVAESASKTRTPAASAKPAAEAPADPDLESLREQVIAGRLAEAEAGLTDLVARHPDDAEAWWTLAECRRKAGNPAAAVEAYREVIAVGTPDRADLARFKAGALLQEKLGRHEEAAALFRDYLTSLGRGAPLRAEALVRCGRSLVAAGRFAEAEPMLREVVDDFGANPVAAEARSLLEKRE
jgi:ferric-dicitrate binding protein FerR (iron transport regulator)/Tfp pilus assembly protein PilF